MLANARTHADFANRHYPVRASAFECGKRGRVLVHLAFRAPEFTSILSEESGLSLGAFAGLGRNTVVEDRMSEALRLEELTPRPLRALLARSVFRIVNGLEARANKHHVSHHVPKAVVDTLNGDPIL